MRSFLLTACLLSLALIGTGRAEAQSLTLSPAVVPLQGSFGQSTTQVLTLRNDSDVAMDFALEAKDVIVRDGQRVFVPAGQLPDSVAATAVFTPRTLRIPPRSSGTAQVTVTLPRSMEHRAMVALFRGTNEVQSGGRRATMSLGTLLTFTVSDRLSLAIGDLQAEAPTASTPALLRSTLVNDGGEPVVSTGTAAILDGRGQLVGKAVFPQRRLLPGERTAMVAEYPGELAAGDYRVVATFDAGGRAITKSSSLTVR